MDPERYRIQSDLRGLLEGEVRCDDVFVQLYASDASLYEIRPLGVVRPRGVKDVSALVQYAAENNLPLHPRGAGTGLAGESVGPGLIVDFSHSMRRILAVNDDTVRVQPGVVHAQLDRALAPYGRLFGPDPATRSVTTMGSVLALDGAGSRWMKYGSARRHVESMQVVLADGSVVTVGKHKVTEPMASGETRLDLLVRRLAELIQREEKTIREHQPKALVNRAGYQLHDVLAGGYLDLAKLLVGSEGTLAFITEATIHTDPLPIHRGVALLFFDKIESAARGALEVAKLDVASCDLMDRRLLSIARESDPRFERLIPRDAEAVLLVEMQGDARDELRDRLQNLVVQLQRRKRLAFAASFTLERDERDLYWRLTRRVVPSLFRLKGSSRPVPFVEDLAVPPEALPEFLVRLQNVLKTHQVTASMFGHAGHGQLHVRPFLDVTNPADVRTMQDLASDIYAEVMAVGGTISGEHGNGLSRTWYLRKQYGPLYEVFRAVKRIFDPQNLFNPGKVVADSPQPLTKNLRPAFVSSAVSIANATGVVAAEAAPTGAESPGLAALTIVSLEEHLVWKGELGLAVEARDCNGCGRCRTQSPDARMCPIFRIGPAEEASPRAKANIVRAVLTGQLKPEELTTDDTKALIDTCVNCHQCRLECPAGVDIPKLVLEAKSQYVVNNGLTMSDWFVSRLDRVAAWASLVRPLTNWALGNRQMRWLLERTFGVAHGRKLPRVAARSFLRRAMRKRLTRSSRQDGRKVLYFVDTYANWFDVELADACVAVLEHNGVSVYVHPDQLPSAMAQITLGDVERAKPLVRRNIKVLADAVRQGYEIVCSEPSAALALRHEYLNLIDDDDARLVAQHSHEVCTYLWQLHKSGQLELDLKPINISMAYHTPCHLRAISGESAGEHLLRLIPGVTVNALERGCSGMAGIFGMKRENFRASLRAGWGLITALRNPEIQYGATECSTCKMQMEQGTSKPTLHPLKVLAYSYGLLPQVSKVLASRSQELTVT